MTRPAYLAAILIFAVAAWLRLPGLADRPMHADEAVYAAKLGLLLETGRWTYEPGEYHGPLLHYVTYGAARLAAVEGYRELTELTLRVVPAVLGIVTVLSPLLLIPGLTPLQALTASAALAVSPAMVYYSRYYIPEMLLVCLTGGLMAVGYRYSRQPGILWAAAAGLLAGLMFATKETAVIAIACLSLAVLATGYVPRGWHIAACAAVTVVVTLIFLGPMETREAMVVYAGRAFRDTIHAHPWDYYFRILLLRSLDAPIILAGAVGAAFVLSGRYTADGSRGLARAVAVYAVVMAVSYSAIPYKTPWCLLGFLHPMALAAGVSVPRKKWTALAVGGCLLVMTYQAYSLSRTHAADPGNPFAYAHTTREVYAIRDRIEKLAAAHDAGRNLPIQVITTQNIWPLPWYFRDFPNVEWRRAVAADMQPAPIILATPDFEPALLHHLYEVRPPGLRPLYVPLLPDHTELRPGLELRGYVQQSLASRE